MKRLSLDDVEGIPVLGSLVWKPVRKTLGVTAFEGGRPVIVRAASAQEIKAALARPEVSCVVVPADRADLLDIDLTELTYG